MEQQLIEGQEVTISSARGPIRRTIVKLIGDVIVVGSKEEYQKAKRHGISRFSVGFRVSDVLEAKSLDGLVCIKHNVHYEQAEHGEASPNRGPDERGQ